MILVPALVFSWLLGLPNTVLSLAEAETSYLYCAPVEFLAYRTQEHHKMMVFYHSLWGDLKAVITTESPPVQEKLRNLRLSLSHTHLHVWSDGQSHRTSAMHSQNLPLLYVNLKPPLICLTLHSQVFPSQNCILIWTLTKHYCDVMTRTRKAWSWPMDPWQAFWQDACKWIETPPGWHEPGPDMDT